MKLDLHVHSRHSHDSLASIPSILKAAKRRGLDGFAITDHGTIKGSIEAAELGRRGDLVVITGAEISTDAGDLIGLFLTDQPKSTTAADLIDEVHGQGGIVVLPHPLRGHRLTDDLLSAVDALEVLNSRESDDSNRAALDLAKRARKPCVGGSDAHFCIEVGTCRTEVESDDIRKEILGGRTRLELKRLPVPLEYASIAVAAVRTRNCSSMLRECAWRAAEGVRGDRRS